MNVVLGRVPFVQFGDHANQLELHIVPPATQASEGCLEGIQMLEEVFMAHVDLSGDCSLDL